MGSKSENIYDLFGEKIDQRTNCPYVPLDISIQLVNLFEENRSQIVGVEGFEVRDGSYYPRMDLIADWTQGGIDFSDESLHFLAEITRKFLREDFQKDKRYVVNFTLKEDW